MVVFKVLLVAFLVLVVSLIVVGLYFQGRVQRVCKPQGDFVEVSGHRVHYIERAGGEVPVVMLHGASSSAVDYKLSLFDKLPEKYKLIAFDRPGMAHSERKFGKEEALGGQLKILHEAVQKLVGRPAYVMTHSLSGVIGARLLSDYPEHYLGMVGIAPALYPIGDGKSWYTIYADIPIVGWFFRNALVPWAAHFVAPVLIDRNFHPNKTPAGYKSDSCLELMFESKRFLNNAHDLNEIRPFLDESYVRYHKIKQPVSLLYGRRDQIVATFSHAYGFRHVVPHVDIQIIEEAGHLPHHFHQDKIASLLSKVESGAAAK
ncbi:MAG: alpha/beta hydrolase [Bdellovibrionales bacterium]|nr:alpha/beta hydrolase [Bdellovibrionales bacterium]